MFELEGLEMGNRGRVIVGILVILGGVLILASAVFDVDLGIFICPGLLVLAGIGLVLRALFIDPESFLSVTVFGPVRREGAWQVADQEVWLLLGDVRLDFTEAEVPPGKTMIRVFAFIGDLRIRAPEHVGISVSSTAIFSGGR